MVQRDNGRRWRGSAADWATDAAQHTTTMTPWPPAWCQSVRVPKQLRIDVHRSLDTASRHGRTWSWDWSGVYGSVGRGTRPAMISQRNYLGLCGTIGLICLHCLGIISYWHISEHLPSLVRAAFMAPRASRAELHYIRLPHLCLRLTPIEPDIVQNGLYLRLDHNPCQPPRDNPSSVPRRPVESPRLQSPPSRGVRLRD